MVDSVKHYILSSTLGKSQSILKDPTIKKYICLMQSPVLHIFLLFLFQQEIRWNPDSSLSYKIVSLISTTHIPVDVSHASHVISVQLKHVFRIKDHLTPLVKII